MPKAAARKHPLELLIESIDPEKLNVTTADGATVGPGDPVYDIDGNEYFVTGWKCADDRYCYPETVIDIVVRTADNTTTRIMISEDGYSTPLAAMIGKRAELERQSFDAARRMEAIHTFDNARKVQIHELNERIATLTTES